MRPIRFPALMPLLLLAEGGQRRVGLGWVAVAADPTGTLLWANISVNGGGHDFSAAVPLPGGDVLLPAPLCAGWKGPCGSQLRRLRPLTGALVWNVAMPTGVWTLALAGDPATPIVLAWASLLQLQAGF